MASKVVKVVLGVTGSVAVYKAGDIVRRLQDHGCEVRVVMTACAQKFVTPLLFEALSGGAVFSDMFSRDFDWDATHVSLAKSNLFLIAPCTANVIGKIASGIADDLLTATAMATRAPLLIAPAMNTGMYTSPAVQANLSTLKKRGVVVVPSKKGRLACGDVGEGALADVDDIVKAALRSLK